MLVVWRSHLDRLYFHSFDTRFNGVALTVKKGITDAFHFLWRTLSICLQALDQSVQQTPSPFLPHTSKGIGERDKDGSHIGWHGYSIAILGVRGIDQLEIRKEGREIWPPGILGRGFVLWNVVLNF